MTLRPFDPRRVRTACVAALCACCAATALLAQAPPANAPPAASPLDAIQDPLRRSVFETVWTTIRDKHFGPEKLGVDWNAALARHAPAAAEAKDAKAFYAAINALLGELGQSHCGAFPPAEAEAAPAEEPHEQGSGEPGDPGIDIRVVDGRAVIVAVAEGGPAAKAGIHPGPIVVAAGGKPLPPIPGPDARRGAPTEWVFHALARLAGPSDRPVKLTLADAPDGPTREVEVGRAPSPMNAFGYLVMPAGFTSRTLDRGVGYVRLGAFVMPVFQQFQKALRGFKDAPGLIIDVRGNPGGIGGIAPGIVGFLSDKALDLGTSRMKEGELRFPVFPRKDPYLGPVAVLIDEASASTSEILALGLKEAGRARLFGRRTAGMALPSVMIKLPDGGGMQFPVAEFLSPKGVALEAVGVAPDEDVAWTMEDCRAGRDPMLAAALRWLATQTKK